MTVTAMPASPKTEAAEPETEEKKGGLKKIVIILVALLGFPVALVMAWVFEATPEGMKFDPVKTGSKRMIAVAIAAEGDIFSSEVEMERAGAPTALPAASSANW